MPIWHSEFSLATIKRRDSNSASAHLGIEMVEIGSDFLRGRMPVDARTRQPAGVLHGGVSVAFAETLASCAASFVADPEKNHCVGLEINANHVSSASTGWVVGTARPLHIGRTTQVWDVRITSEDGSRLICVSRVTIAVLSKPSEY